MRWLPPPSSDSAAKLVKLGQSEAVGVFDNHDRGIGNIDADLDHGGRDQHLHLARREALHHVGALRRLEAAVHQIDPRVGKGTAQPLERIGRGAQIDLLRLLDQRIHDVRLLAPAEGPARAWSGRQFVIDFLTGSEHKNNKHAAP